MIDVSVSILTKFLTSFVAGAGAGALCRQRELLQTHYSIQETCAWKLLGACKQLRKVWELCYWNSEYFPIPIVRQLEVKPFLWVYFIKAKIPEIPSIPVFNKCLPRKLFLSLSLYHFFQSKLSERVFYRAFFKLSFFDLKVLSWKTAFKIWNSEVDCFYNRELDNWSSFSLSSKQVFIGIEFRLLEERTGNARAIGAWNCSLLLLLVCFSWTASFCRLCLPEFCNERFASDAGLQAVYISRSSDVEPCICTLTRARYFR